MLATILFPIPLVGLPLVQQSQPTRDCWLEVLTPQAIEARAIADFGAKVHAYVELRRRFVKSMGAPVMIDDEGGICGDELCAVIVAARLQARLYEPLLGVLYQ